MLPLKTQKLILHYDLEDQMISGKVASDADFSIFLKIGFADLSKKKNITRCVKMRTNSKNFIWWYSVKCVKDKGLKVMLHICNAMRKRLGIFGGLVY